MDVRLEQLEKARPAIDERLDDIFTVRKLLHPLNVYRSIEVTPDGIVMDVNDSHPLNACIPIVLTVDGMTMVFKFLQL